MSRREPTSQSNHRIASPSMRLARKPRIRTNDFPSSTYTWLYILSMMIRSRAFPFLNSIRSSTTSSQRLASLASQNGVKTLNPVQSPRSQLQARLIHHHHQTHNQTRQIIISFISRPSCTGYNIPNLEHLYRQFHNQQNRYQEQTSYQGQDGEYYQIPRVKYLRPTIWAITVSASIYTFLAYLEAKRSLKERSSSSVLTRGSSTWSLGTSSPASNFNSLPSTGITSLWNSLDPMRKLSSSIIASCLLVQGTNFLAPGFFQSLWHIPARNANYTLLTSTFVHAGGFHIFFNMYVLHNFIRPIGYSPVFEGKTTHALSFYLSAGILSGLAQHCASALPSQRAVSSAIISSGGASGALFALLGVFCSQYPDAKLGLFFIPVYFEAPYVLSGLMLFDLVGVLRGGFSFLPLGHAVSNFSVSLSLALSCVLVAVDCFGK